MHFLIIDVGTSSIRGVLYHVSGEQLFVHQISYHPDFLEEGWAEQDPADWRDTLTEIGRETAAFCEEKGFPLMPFP